MQEGKLEITVSSSDLIQELLSEYILEVTISTISITNSTLSGANSI